MNYFVTNSPSSFATRWVAGLKEKVRHALVSHVLELVKRQPSLKSAFEKEVVSSPSEVHARTESPSSDCCQSSSKDVIVGNVVSDSSEDRKEDGVYKNDENLACVEKVSSGDGLTSKGTQKEERRKKSNPKKPADQAQKMDETTEEIHAYLTSHFELRYNVLTEHLFCSQVNGMRDFL